MSVLYLTTPLTRVRLENAHLIVSAPPSVGVEQGGGGTTTRVPLAELERVTVCDTVQLTSSVIGALMRNSVPLAFTDQHGRLLGLMDQPASQDGALRQLQYRRSLECGFCLGLARELIGAKIGNQIRLLQRLGANRPDRLKPDELCALRQAAEAARVVGDTAALLGVEGAATRRYFELWSRFLPQEFPFVVRSTRPPRNAVNATISFVSAIFYNLLTGLIHRRGLDPAIGFLHATDNRRYALALDLMEPFRPAVIEPFVTRLFVHRILGVGDFEPVEGGIHLNRGGRGLLLYHWEKRLRRLFQPKETGNRSSMLQEIEARIVNYKRALENPEEFAPFRMP